MPASIQTTKQLVEREVGRWSIDIQSGWEAGMKGKQRVEGKLIDRLPPSHLQDQVSRLCDWIDGHRAAKTYRNLSNNRSVLWTAQHDSGTINGKRKGWSISRSQIVNNLAENGCYGDVIFLYFEGDNLVRKVNAGI